MDATEFEKRVRDPGLTKEQLENYRANALAKGKQEFAIIANEVLRERFTEKARRGGSTPTTTVFLGETKNFQTGKDAYLHLVERFRMQYPGLLDNQDKWHARAFAGVKRKYFARTPVELFPADSNQVNSDSNFFKLTGAWYANTNLNHEEKFQILLRLGAICRLAFPRDWDFTVTGASADLISRRETTLLVERLLQELADPQ